MSAAEPLIALQQALQAQGGVQRLGVAVSGGGDSLAAMLLAVEALGAGRVAAVTVDHGLRAESASEARFVAEICARLGVAHQVLNWGGAEAEGNLQDAARRARFRLIGTWAAGRVEAVIVAHTLEDQAETLLMRLARGSGVDGLAAMATAREHGGMLWLRPFLNTTREALREVLQARGQEWIEDPSNEDRQFQRVRVRQTLAALEPLGITAQGLAQTATRMQHARAALEAQTQAALTEHVTEDRGTLLIDRAALTLAEEIRDRLFAHLLMALSHAPYRPRLAALQRLVTEGGMLSGCVLSDEGAHLRLAREAQAVAGQVVPVGEIWDQRWTATGPKTDNAQIAATGTQGLAQLSAQAKSGLHPHWRDSGLSEATLRATPAIWQNQRLIAAPFAFYPQKWQLFARPIPLIGKVMAISH
ncbi:tRNA lysidine(34) synthetase TilS [Pararhodobacter oceanensis]|uniref:tRNA lysidine(34) synthetase TilS n=1 Tax=Pararhodobacter oceanensis TaxID=2172121 RepID=UPI003A8F8266